ARELADILGEPFDTKGVKKMLDELIPFYESSGGGILLREVANGYQFITNPENAEYLRKMIDIKPFKLSRAALETLAIVAYRQPVTKSEVEEIRGVDSSGALRVLIEKRLVRIVGKKDEPGRPFLYGTTKEFMEFFDLKSLADLPTLKDLEQIAREINEESGVAKYQEVVQYQNTESEATLNKEEMLKEEIMEEVQDTEELQEEHIAQQFEEALKRVENTNKMVKESLGLIDVKDATVHNGAERASDEGLKETDPDGEKKDEGEGL
ncbi:MAG: SMC-Scp complex subunit ScpB, partial [Myxococcota bacterium]